MGRYILRRVLLIFPTLFLISVAVFSIVRFIPGDAATMMVSEQGYGADVEAVKKMLGLDKPWPEQYVIYMSGVLRGDLGTSLWTKRKVTDELAQRIPVSIELGVLSTLISLGIAIPIGVISAIRQDTWSDYLGRSFAIGGLSIPSFWISTIVLVLPAAYFGWVPPMKFVPLLEDPVRNLGLFLMPAAIMGIHLAAGIMRMTRAMMLEVLRQDYIRTAWAKGLTEQAVIVAHALKNAMIPVVTILGMQLSLMLGGTVIMESIFNLPGMGRFLIDAINWRDYPVIQGINLIIAAAVVFMNLVVDLAYVYLDPRIRYR